MNTRAEEFILNLLLKEKTVKQGMYYIPKFLRKGDHWYVKNRKYHKIPGSEKANLESLKNTLEQYGFRITRSGIESSLHPYASLTHYIMYEGICEGEVYS